MQTTCRMFKKKCLEIKEFKNILKIQNEKLVNARKYNCRESIDKQSKKM